MLYTRQVKKTIDFYVNNLGFTCTNRSEDWSFATLNRDGIEVMVTLPNEHTQFTNPTFTGSFYINTDEVDDLWEELKEKAVICYPVETFDYGMREFAVYDNNGYLLQFGKAIN